MKSQENGDVVAAHCQRQGDVFGFTDGVSLSLVKIKEEVPLADFSNLFVQVMSWRLHTAYTPQELLPYFLPPLTKGTERIYKVSCMDYACPLYRNGECSAQGVLQMAELKGIGNHVLMIENHISN